MGIIHNLNIAAKPVINEVRDSLEVIYEISSIIDNYKDTGCVYAIVHIKGTSNTFQKSIKELYQEKWLNNFSREDVAHIGFLYASELSGDLSQVYNFPIKKQKVTKNVVVLGMLFVTFLVLSNLTAFKITEIDLARIVPFNLIETWKVNFPGALIFFPLTYFFDDTLTEVYGFKISRLIIWSGLIANTILVLGCWVTVYLPPSPMWNASTHNGQQAYSLVFTSSLRVFVASLVGYFFGEFLNSVILAKLKILTGGRLLFLRVLGSTVVGVGIDSIIFCNIAFWGIFQTSMIWSIVLFQYCFKILCEIVLFPITYTLSNFLKRQDQVDYYDFKTKFNPFSMKID